ncbi:MAG TPA: hypothetical protein VIM85_00725 [Pseudomonadales bacterium]
MKNFNLLTLAITLTLVAAGSSASVEKEPAPAVAPAAEINTKPVIGEPTPKPVEAIVEEVVEEETVAETEPEPVISEAVSDIEYTCEHGGSKRIIRVFNDTAAGLACEVTYEKASGTKTLWTAVNDKEYCAQKAAAFASKQVGWGWSCVSKDGVVVSAPVVEAPVIEDSTPEAPAEVEALTPEAVEPEATEIEIEIEEEETEVLIEE